jgi:hypothetical protein
MRRPKNKKKFLGNKDTGMKKILKFKLCTVIVADS